MREYGQKMRALAACLSALAGYVDAIGFIKSGGFFASFMSGNSTRLAVGLVDTAAHAGMAAGLILTFVGGVAAGSIIGHHCHHNRRPALLILIALLLIGAAGMGASWSVAAIFPLAFAMGMENAIFEQGGETRIGLTYMTGSLVRVGQGLAGLLTGQKRDGWVAYLILWLSLSAGAVLGAISFQQLGNPALWMGAGMAAILAIPAYRLRHA